MFHRKGKASAKAIRTQMYVDDILFYYSSLDDYSGAIMEHSRVRLRVTDTVIYTLIYIV